VDRPVTDSPHELLNPESLPPPRGFSHAAVAVPGRTVHLAGQTGHRADGTLAGEGIVAQFDQACANVVEALRAAGAEPRHLISLLIYTTDLGVYRQERREVGEAYRRHFGRHYPAMALIGVSELVDPAAKVELVGVAVVPDGG
jgi:enamine deaminase RidA (YjgF/YER057c/UK114 family)